MRNYSTARGILSFIEFVAWTVVVAGVIVALLGAGTGNMGGAALGRGVGGAVGGFLGALPGLFVALVGLIFAAFIQLCRASVDTAEMTGKMLKIAEEQLQVAKKTATVSIAPSASIAPSHAPSAIEKSAEIVASVSDHSASHSGEPAISGDGSAQGNGIDASSLPGPTAQDGYELGDVIEHRMIKIEKTDIGFIVLENNFRSLDEAKSFVDKKIYRGR